MVDLYGKCSEKIFLRGAFGYDTYIDHPKGNRTCYVNETWPMVGPHLLPEDWRLMLQRCHAQGNAAQL